MFKATLLAMSVLSFIPFSSDAHPIEWESCLNNKFQSWFDDYPNPRLRCGYLEVPLHYKNGTSDEAMTSDSTVRLAMTLLPARGLRKGSIVMISGGPGMPGINPYLDLEWPVSRLSESWDIIGYDPRGVGQSVPKISCKMSDIHHESGKTLSPEQEARNMLDACIKNTGVDVLKHVGTDEAVSDVDRIRHATGDKKLTAVAYSYGTQVGLLYAERFPESVRALVLDGVVDLEEAKDDFTVRLNQARGYQITFERFAVWCAESGSCPLSADKSVATRQYRDLLHQLHLHPLSDADGRKISSDELISLTTDLLLWRASWPALATAVRQFSAGIVSKEVSDRLSTYSAMPDYSDALSVISCADQSVHGLNLNEIIRQKTQVNEAFAAINYQPQQKPTRDLCDIWPWKSNVLTQRPTRLPRLPHFLFVAQRHDPTTPWNNARTMATQFKSPLMTLEGDGHTLVLTGANLCVDKGVVDYLMNPEKKMDDIICR